MMSMGSGQYVIRSCVDSIVSLGRDNVVSPK